MGILSNEDLFYKIADFWFVRSAFQAIVFNKLFYDGYKAILFAAMKDYIPTTRNRCRNNSKENRSSIL